MKILKIFFLIFSSVWMTQCADKAQEPSKVVKKKLLFQYQIDALNRAKKVNQTIIDSTKRKRKQIDAID